ncbi:MAG TPA: hypothetical protein VM306_04225, partial [Lentzea sp.]|nr:hypothetical protein [Lentzea sp.]
LRGLIRAVQAAQHRRWGDIAAAIGAAREGLDLLSRFVDPAADSGQGIGRLTLELVLALMDANRLLDASEVGTPLLERPVRAPSASTSGWLRLALATRVHLPAGRVALAREMLREAAVSAERHQLDTLLAESLLALAHVHEVSGELADALTNLRSAHAAERRRARAVYAVRARLAAEFAGVHRQPADLHQQLASLLRPIEGVQVVTDGVLSAALKQQLRQWRPVQVRKGDGLKVKRVRRAAEDMTVDGLSAARQHAADRWRMVQPFGEPDDKTPDPVEPPPSSSSDRTVPASGLIASAGAMVSGRRRAARVAAGEIDDDQPTAVTESPATPEPQLTPDQERKRKVEQQLMELQREARRQIEAERQARADQRAKAEREAAEEAAREAAAREEAARQEAARQEAARQEAAREAAAREEAARAEAAAREESSRSQPESVMDMLKAQGLRAGGRRRAPDSEAQSETPSWRVEPPSHRRQDDPAQDQSPNYFADPAPASDSAPQNLAAGAHSAPDGPNYFADPDTPDRPSRSGLAAAFSRPPAAPDFGPHLDDSAPAYPPLTPAGGFPSSPAPEDERRLPERDYTNLAFTTPQWSTASIPSPEPAEHPDPTHPNPTNPAPPSDPDPDHKPLPPIPDPVPQVPTPDEIPQPTQPDLLSSTFLSSADMEAEDDPSTLPTTPVRVTPTPDQPGSTPPAFGSPSGFGAQDGFGAQPGSETEPGFGGRPSSGAQPSFGTQSGFGTQPGFDTQPTFGPQTSFGTQSAFGSQTSFGTQPTFGTQSGFGTQPDATPPSDQADQPDPAAWANFDFGPDFEADTNVVMLTGPATTAGPSPATYPDFAAQPGQSTAPDPAAPAEAGFGSDPQYDFFASESEPVVPSATTDQFGIAETDIGDATPTGGEPAGAGQPAEAKGESGTRTGRPSSRRKPSDLSLADLLTEALVAYETGRRSDEEQLEAADLATSGLSTTDPEPPDAAAQPYLAQRPGEAEPPPSADSLFHPGQSIGSQMAAEAQSGADFSFRPGQSFGLPQPPAAAEGQSTESGFGSQRPTAETPQPGSASYLLPEQPYSPYQPFTESTPATQPEARPPTESEQEKTGPIVPVGATPDSETTGPIRPVRPDGPAGWTLPGT